MRILSLTGQASVSTPLNGATLCESEARPRQPEAMDRDSGLIIRRRDEVQIGTSDSALRRGLRTGSIVTVTAGVYADALWWQHLDGIERHRERVLATADRMPTSPVFSHFAAAALWGIRILGRWPELVDVTLDRATGGRSDGRIRRHCTGLEAVAVVHRGGLLVTTPAQTVADLARILPFTDAVAAIDSALHRRRRPRPLTTPDEVMRAVAAFEGGRGHRAAVAAARFSTPLSDSVKESQSRVLLHGFPAPVLQQKFRLPTGRDAEVDFFWPDHSHIGECDGRSKYRDPALLNGRTPEEVYFDEKERENQLRRMVRGFSRWEPSELDTPRRLYDRLVRDGLPSSRRRP